MRALRLLLVPFTLLVASSAMATLTPPSLSWRAYPVATDISPDQNILAGQIAPLTSGADAAFYPTVSTLTDPWIAFQAGSTVLANSNWMITFGSLFNRVVTNDGSNAGNCQKASSICSTDVTLEFQYSADAGASGSSPTTGWTSIGTTQSYQELDQYTVSVNPNYWYKLIVHLDPNTTRPRKLYINDLAIYDMSGSQPKDYWLMLGASIEVQSVSNKDWKKDANALFGADPVVFNMSRGGWGTTQLLPWLDYFLAMHPNATYCAVHIAGNTVSFYRPYPGGSQLLQNDMQTIVTKIIAAGKIPVLTRLTYRQYTSPNVPPQINGSWPYNANNIDPIIQQYTPDFYDPVRQRGYIDGYSFIRMDPNDWLLDSTHMTPAGEAAWQQFLVQRPGTLIYGTQPNCANNQNIPCLSIADCGNGVLEAGEECDDGNRDPNDGCNNDCILYEGTGAESLTPAAPVFCPDGTVYPGDCVSSSTTGGTSATSTTTSATSTTATTAGTSTTATSGGTSTTATTAGTSTTATTAGTSTTATTAGTSTTATTAKEY